MAIKHVCALCEWWSLLHDVGKDFLVPRKWSEELGAIGMSTPPQDLIIELSRLGCDPNEPINSGTTNTPWTSCAQRARSQSYTSTLGRQGKTALLNVMEAVLNAGAQPSEPDAGTLAVWVRKTAGYDSETTDEDTRSKIMSMTVLLV
jgi:hypothetical protein